MQAFEVLRSFGGLHDLSAALIIGGRDVSVEKQHIQTMNILIATPGRLMEHIRAGSIARVSGIRALLPP